MENAFYIYNQNIFGSGKHFFIPGVKAIFGRVENGEAEFCHELRFNNWGFRDDVPYAKEKNGKEFRIATIGDSFTIDLDSEIPWPWILEKMLKEQYGGGVKIYNLGLTGAGPSNWINLKRTVKKLAPDLIIMSFYDGIITRPYIKFHTEPAKNRFFCTYGKFLTYSRPVGISDSRFPNITKSEYERYAASLAEENRKSGTRFNPLSSAVVKAVNNISARGESGTGKAKSFSMMSYAAKAAAWVRSFDGVNRNKKIVEKIAKWAPAIVVASFPSLGKMLANTTEPDVQDTFLVDFTRKKGIKYISFMNILQNRSVNPKDIFTASSSHWNVKGNNLIAEIFTEGLAGYIK